MLLSYVYCLKHPHDRDGSEEFRFNCIRQKYDFRCVRRMNTQLVNRFRSIQTPRRLYDSFVRQNKRCVHRDVVKHCQEGQKEGANEMKEYWQRRAKLLASNPVKYSTSNAAKWDMRTMGTSSNENSVHRSMSAILSLTVLMAYFFMREENDLDENILSGGKTSEEFQQYLDQLKEKKRG